MSKFYPAIDDQFRDFIDEQKMFFTASAPMNGRVNVSPKGMDTFRVLGTNEVAYLDLTGSGNETAAHVKENGRITFMFCSFGRQPVIMRLYTTARVVQKDDDGWDELVSLFPELPGTRQIFVAHVDALQTSCGYGVPEYDIKRERPTLQQWSVMQGDEGMAEYWETYNTKSIDGLATGLKLE
jgi:hypothetical protein